MQVSLLLATRQTHSASAGVRGALFGWSVVKSRDTDVRYYVCGTGKVQGDPASGALQAVGMQPSLVDLDAACQEGGGMTRAGADDVFAIGPPDVVLPAVQTFARASGKDAILSFSGQSVKFTKEKVNYLLTLQLDSLWLAKE